MKKILCALALLLLLGIVHSYPSIGAPKPNRQVKQPKKYKQAKQPIQVKQDEQAQQVVKGIRMPISFQADFVYTHIQGDTKQEDTQEEYQIEGKIWVKGNKYRLVLEDQIVVSNGETIWNYVPSMQEVQIYNEKPATADEDLTSFSPTQLLHLYKQDFVPIAVHTTTIDQKKREVVELIAQDKKSDIKHLNLVLDKIDEKGYQIKSMQVLEKDGTVHNFSIVNLVVQNKLKNSFFEFQMPAEPVEVVDLR
jgi:outer membrane lipoprotein-sorting protein